jgi:hypothetical protein
VLQFYCDLYSWHKISDRKLNSVSDSITSSYDFVQPNLFQSVQLRDTTQGFGSVPSENLSTANWNRGHTDLWQVEQSFLRW